MPLKKPWFGPKRYGYGVGAPSWQGWVVILIYIAALIVSLKTASALPDYRPWMGWAIMAALTAVLVVVAGLTGSREPMRWRWGGK